MAAPVPTYYDVLQVPRDASADDIRGAWRRLAHRYHPDKMPGNPNAARAMAAINAAYDELSDPHRRALHDRWIAHAEAPPLPCREAPGAQAASAWGALNPVTGWPWYLLFATMAFALATVGTAVYLTTRPALAVPAVHPAKPPAAKVAPVPLQPAGETAPRTG